MYAFFFTTVSLKTIYFTINYFKIKREYELYTEMGKLLMQKSSFTQNIFKQLIKISYKYFINFNFLHFYFISNIEKKLY